MADIVVPCLLYGNIYLILFTYGVHERSHMRLVCESDPVCDDRTAHIVRHYLALGSENAAPWLHLFAVVVEYFCA